MKSLATFSFAGPSETFFVRHARVKKTVLSSRAFMKYPRIGTRLIHPASDSGSGEDTFNCLNGMDTVSCMSGPYGDALPFGRNPWSNSEAARAEAPAFRSTVFLRPSL